MEMSGDLVEDNHKTEESQPEEEEVPPQLLKGKKLSRQKLRRFDSLDIESSSVRGHHAHGSKVAFYKFTFLLFIYLFYFLYIDSGYMSNIASLDSSLMHK